MTRAAVDPLEVVHRLSDLQQVYQILLDEVVDILDVEKASIMVYDEEAGGLRVAAARGMDPTIMKEAFVQVGEGISGRVFESDEPMLIEDIRAQGGPSGPGDRYKTTSLMSAPVTTFPLRMGDQPLGVINVTDRRDGSAFTDEDLRLLTTASNQVAAYMHITRLAKEVREAERLKGELEVARTIQQRLLPSKPLDLDALDVAGKVVPAQKVGGDYFDYFLTHTRRPSFVIADVSGHNIPAAMITAALRSTVRAQRDADYAPAAMVQRVNAILFDDLSSTEQFISLVYLQYLQSRQVVRYTNAGHPPPLVWRAGMNEFEELSTEDPLLGIDPMSVYHERTLVVSHGDVIALYTDGLPDASNAAGERYGVNRLKETVHGEAGLTSSGIVDAIIESVLAFAGVEPIRDDISVLVCKVL
jgi:serine phosphatase RsbU (regulator of sigma subunit)